MSPQCLPGKRNATVDYQRKNSTYTERKIKAKSSKQLPSHNMSPLDMATVDSILTNKTYAFLENKRTLLQEKKGLRRKLKGTGKQL